MTPRERADRAKEMLESAVFKAAFSDIRESLVASVESSAFGDYEAHHELAITLQLLRRLKTQLSRYADEIAIDKAMQREKSWMQKARQFMP